MPRHELILGGARSGKSRAAEGRAAAWLATPGHDALLIATATAGDAEMRQRIQRHRHDRALRVPGLAVDEVPLALAAAIGRHAAPKRLLVVDCLTLWLTNLCLPLHGAALDDDACAAHVQALCQALQAAAGPVVLVSNEIGQGVMPMQPEARRFVDALGRLHQVVAGACARVTWMLAGIEVPVKGAARP